MRKTVSLSLLWESLLSWGQASGFPCRKCLLKSGGCSVMALRTLRLRRFFIQQPRRSRLQEMPAVERASRWTWKPIACCKQKACLRPPITQEILQGYIEHLAKANGRVDRKTSLKTPQDQPGKLLASSRNCSSTFGREMLGANRVGVWDNFYDLGGHSLVALRIISRINDYFRIELSVRSLLEFPVLREFADELLLISGRSAAEMEKIAKIGLMVRQMSPEQRKTALAAAQ